MPLWEPYDEMLKSDIADLANAANSPMAGCITAAMFLKRFVPDGLELGPSRHLRVARQCQAGTAQGGGSARFARDICRAAGSLLTRLKR